MSKKIIVIVSHPIQYHAVLWRNMAKLEDVDFEVWFCSDHGQKKSLDKDFGVAFKWDIPLTNGYKHRFWKNIGFGNGFFKYINLGMIVKLIFSKTDFVYFHGVNNFSAYSCFWISKLKRSKTIIRNIAHLLDYSDFNGTKFKLRNLIYGSVFRKATVCLYIGKHNKDFYKHFKVQEDRLVHAPHVVDNEFFREKSLDLESQIELKKEMGIDTDGLVLLFCGKFISIKQPLMLLNAYIDSDLINKSTILLVGDGNLKDEMIRVSEKLDRKNALKKILFLGFQNQSELPKIYSITDVIILPSKRETWGLVVNESLIFEIATIVGDGVGCGPELVENKTGYIINHKSVDELKRAIERMVNEPSLTHEFKKNTLNIINNWSINEFIKSIKLIING